MAMCRGPSLCFHGSVAASAQAASLQSAEAEVLRLEQLIAETRASTQAAVQEAKSQLDSVALAQEQARLLDWSTKLKALSTQRARLN